MGGGGQVSIFFRNLSISSDDRVARPKNGGLPPVSTKRN